MEKSSVKPRNRFLKLLPRAASVITFHSPPFSPNKEKRRSSSSESTCSTKPKTHLGKGSGSSGNAASTHGAAGQITSIIPAQARYSKSRSSSSFGVREPTSPKISCMGQIKHKKKMCKLYQESLPPPVPLQYIDQVLNFNNKTKQRDGLKPELPRVLKPIRSFKNMFGASKRSGATTNNKNNANSKSNSSVDDHDSSVRAPSLSQMSGFSSGRSALSSFDWTAAAQIAPVVSNDHGGEAKISLASASASAAAAAAAAGVHVIQNIGECKDVSLEARKEINLWKRRTMPQPTPLQLSVL